MQYALIFAGLAGFTLASPTEKRDACSDACYTAYNTCRGQPDANRAVCASDFATCLGYSPFDSSGSLVTPTACSVTASGYPYKTPSASASAAPTSDACANACSDAYNTCRGQPDANRAVCASDYANCLGYSPFDSSGSLVTPTACSITTAASTYATASASPTPDACAQKCEDELRACQSQPDSNKATCAANYATCLGYNPYSPSFVEPTACSTTGGASGSPTVVYTTEVVTALTTYCPASTTITVNSRTYAVSSATTLIITDCPCTVTRASEASYPAATPTPATSAPGTSVPATSVPATSVPATVPASSSATQATGTTVVSPTTTSPGTVVTAAADVVKPALALIALGAVALI